MPNVLWVNGRFVGEDEKVLTAVDRGFTLGDGVFETMRASNGVIWGLVEHLTRLHRGAEILEIPLAPQPSLMDGLEDVLARVPAEEVTLRLTLSRGPDLGRGIGILVCAEPTVVIRAAPYMRYAPELYAKGMNAAIVSIRRNETSPLARIKSCNYGDAILARREALEKGCEEALLLNTRGELASASVANLFIVAEGRLMTPPEASGVLPGITRGRVLQAAKLLGLPAEEVPFYPETLLSAEEAFLTNTLMGIMPLTAVDQHIIGTGWPGPVVRELGLALALQAPASYH